MKPIQSLKVSISGVRGVVGDSLKPALLCRFARAFATYLGKGTVIVGRDTRRSGEMVENAVHAGLLASGMSVITVGICPVPTIQHAVPRLKGRGGIAITASHNPAQWNALKFIKSNGHFLNRFESEELLALYHQEDFSQVEAARIRPLVHHTSTVEEHISAILETIRPLQSPRLKVVVDCCNGAGAVETPRLLRALGCEVVEVNCLPDGNFPRPPEPIPQNLGDLKDAVIAHSADIGFAQDADADRLAIVSDEGIAIGEEYSLALCVDHILHKTKGPVVCNLSTSRMIDDIGDRHGCRVIRTRIGEVNVTEAITEYGAVIGGEGNGGVIYPTVNMARDSFVGIALILNLMRSQGERISSLARGLPTYQMRKLALEIHPHVISTLIDRLSNEYSHENLNFLDGLKIEREEGWIHLRPSNTEPIMRVVIEARDDETLRKFEEEVRSKIDMAAG